MGCSRCAARARSRGPELTFQHPGVPSGYSLFVVQRMVMFVASLAIGAPPSGQPFSSHTLKPHARRRAPVGDCSLTIGPTPVRQQSGHVHFPPAPVLELDRDARLCGRAARTSQDGDGGHPGAHGDAGSARSIRGLYEGHVSRFCDPSRSRCHVVRRSADAWAQRAVPVRPDPHTSCQCRLTALLLLGGCSQS